MPSTWAGTASNQLITRAALQDAVNAGLFGLISGQTITGTTQICTKSYIDARIINVNNTSGTYAGLSSTRCPTKSVLANAKTHNIRIYGTAQGSDLIRIRFLRNGTAYYLTSWTGLPAGCNFQSGFNEALVGDVGRFLFSTAALGDVQGYVAKGSTTCGGGTLGCPPVDIAITVDDPYILNWALAFRVPNVQCA